MSFLSSSSISCVGPMQFSGLTSKAPNTMHRVLHTVVRSTLVPAAATIHLQTRVTSDHVSTRLAKKAIPRETYILGLLPSPPGLLRRPREVRDARCGLGFCAIVPTEAGTFDKASDLPHCQPRMIYPRLSAFLAQQVPSYFNSSDRLLLLIGCCCRKCVFTVTVQWERARETDAIDIHSARTPFERRCALLLRRPRSHVGLL